MATVRRSRTVVRQGPASTAVVKPPVTGTAAEPRTDVEAAIRGVVQPVVPALHPGIHAADPRRADPAGAIAPTAPKDLTTPSTVPVSAGLFSLHRRPPVIDDHAAPGQLDPDPIPETRSSRSRPRCERGSPSPTIDWNQGRPLSSPRPCAAIRGERHPAARQPQRTPFSLVGGIPGHAFPGGQRQRIPLGGNGNQLVVRFGTVHHRNLEGVEPQHEDRHSRDAKPLSTNTYGRYPGLLTCGEWPSARPADHRRASPESPCSPGPAPRICPATGRVRSSSRTTPRDDALPIGAAPMSASATSTPTTDRMRRPRPLGPTARRRPSPATVRPRSSGRAPSRRDLVHPGVHPQIVGVDGDARVTQRICQRTHRDGEVGEARHHDSLPPRRRHRRPGRGRMSSYDPPADRHHHLPRARVVGCVERDWMRCWCRPTTSTPSGPAAARRC